MRSTPRWRRRWNHAVRASPSRYDDAESPAGGTHVSRTGTAVVGTGFIGPVHVEALRRLGRDVVGVLGSTPERGRTAARTWGLAKAYDTYEAVLTDPAVNVIHLT